MKKESTKGIDAGVLALLNDEELGKLNDVLSRAERRHEEAESQRLRPLSQLSGDLWRAKWDREEAARKKADAERHAKAAEKAKSAKKTAARKRPAGRLVGFDYTKSRRSKAAAAKERARVATAKTPAVNKGTKLLQEPNATTAPKFKRGELQARIIESLSKGKRHIDDIAKAANGKVTTIASVVSKMAAKGAIKKLGDGMYEAVKP